MKDSKEGEKEQPMEGEKKKFAVDPDSGMVFELKPQGPLDIAVARSSYVYLLLMLAFFFWLLFDIWMGRHTLAHVLGYQPVERLDTPTFRLMAYTVIGGGMGGIICGIRSILIWHGDLEAFGGRFLWKYITSPWLGATLALFVYAVIRGGIAAFGGGDYTTQAAGTNQSFAALGVGVLAGYGSRKVLTWLDGLVKRMFKGTLTVPYLVGRNTEEAKDILECVGLKEGKVTEETSSDPTVEEGTVMKQMPAPDSTIAKGGEVDLTVAAKKEEDQTKV